MLNESQLMKMAARVALTAIDSADERPRRVSLTFNARRDATGVWVTDILLREEFDALSQEETK